MRARLTLGVHRGGVRGHERDPARPGLDALWLRIEAHREALEAAGRLAPLRADQAVRWMWRAVDDELRRGLRGGDDVAALAAELEGKVRRGETAPTAAAARILERFGVA